MKLTRSSTARRRTAIASARFLGGPQIPSPVRRIAPNPRRWRETSPPSKTLPAKLADISFAIMILLVVSFGLVLFRLASFNPDALERLLVTPQGEGPKLPLCGERPEIAYDFVNLTSIQRSLERRHSALAVRDHLSEFRVRQPLDCL